MANDFYWRTARDSLITPDAVRKFQILTKYDGKDFDDSKQKIDKEYLVASGRTVDRRHGGKIQTMIRVFQEAGWVELEKYDTDKQRIKITDVGRQADALLSKLPDFLKAIPYFLVELFTRYQLKNPARPSSRNPDYDKLLEDCNIFPYWTLYKLMLECDRHITSDELKRFVFKIQNTKEIPDVIKSIKDYRKDKEAGLPEADLDKKYPIKLTGAVAEPKYIMGRLGTQVGKHPPIIQKQGQDKWVINDNYLSFVKEIVNNEPIFKEHITEKSWMAEHGKFIEIMEEFIPPPGEDEVEDEDEDLILDDDLPDDDSVWLQAKDLLDHGAPGVVFSGPLGTSKTWYASKIAIKITSGKAKCIKQIQFHPSYSYDDFVEGYVPTGDSSKSGGSALFKVVDKIFLKICKDAKRDPDNTYVLVIDEFSRGDPSRIFGELLTYIEKDYRNKKFILPFSGKKRAVPENIVILGTMNPYDKSVSDLDVAMDRRFEKVPMDPSVNILKKLVKAAGMEDALMGKIIDFFNETNKRCPHGFGHTYFLNIKDENDLTRLWNHNLRFAFEKMFRFEPHVYDDIKESYKKLVSEPEKLA